MEAQPVITSDVLNSMFCSLPPELRLQIYSDVYNNSFEDILTLISMFEADRLLFGEALDFLCSNHTFELRCKKSIDDDKWLPLSWLPQVLRLSIKSVRSLPYSSIRTKLCGHSCGENSIAKIAISNPPNLQTGKTTRNTLSKCVNLKYLKIITTKLPRRNHWTVFIELLDVFPCLNELVITIPRIPFLRHEDS